MKRRELSNLSGEAKEPLRAWGPRSTTRGLKMAQKWRQERAKTNFFMAEWKKPQASWWGGDTWTWPPALLPTGWEPRAN